MNEIFLSAFHSSSSTSVSQCLHAKYERVILAHFKWTGRPHELHLMELLGVSSFGKNRKQMVQKSMSASDGSEGVDGFFVLGRLAGGGRAFFFAAFPGVFVACFFCFKRRMLSGEVNSKLSIALRLKIKINKHKRNTNRIKIT